jgi:hypothetical protein
MGIKSVSGIIEFLWLVLLHNPGTNDLMIRVIDLVQDDATP